MKADNFRDGLLYSVPIDHITPNPGNPRKDFDQAELEELAQSIREVGILQPLVLVPEEESGMLRIVAGERRWRAAQLAGLDSVNALVRRLTPAQEAKIMLIENLQRKDLDPIEEARAYQELLSEYGYTQGALGEELGVSQSHIANRLRLLRLPDDVKENISHKILSAGHAHALMKLEKSPAIMKKAAESLTEEGVPVARAAQTIAGVIAREGKPLFENWREDPEFDVSGCEDCEYRALGDRYGVGDEEDQEPYCIKPGCWEKKQREARQTREEELARKAEKKGIVDLDGYDFDQYETFRWYNTREMDISECEECEHKKLAQLPYSDEPEEVCLKPSCFRSKKAAFTRERGRQEREKFKEEVNQIGILAGLKAACHSGPGWISLDRPTLVYITASILANVDQSGDRKITRYRYLKDKHGWENEILKRSDWALMDSDWDEFRELLESLTDQQLLEIIFEWPAVARGLNGAAGWVLQKGEEPHGIEECS